MKIFDCVTYFNEDKILNLRFEILNKSVDFFVIVECSHEHSGNFKGKNFDINKFPKFKEKIIYHYVDIKDKKELLYKSKTNSFLIENYQRNCIGNTLNYCKDDDLIIISDCDEIPKINKKIINKFVKERYFKQYFFIQKFYYYKPNLQLYEKFWFGIKQVRWLGSKLIKKKDLKYPQDLRSLPSYSRFNLFRTIIQKTKLIENGGWHLSFMQKPMGIQKKISSYAHQEYNNSNFNTLDVIEKKIKNNQDLFNRGFILKYQNKDSLVDFLKDNNISLF